MCTNICQILTPVAGLMIVMGAETFLTKSIDKFADKVVYIPVPQIFNLNYKALGNIGDFLQIDSCDQWYMYSFDDKVSQDERDFFGYNEGDPWSNPKSSGMLKSGKNILSMPCPDVNKTVPYFKEFNQNKYKGY